MENVKTCYCCFDTKIMLKTKVNNLRNAFAMKMKKLFFTDILEVRSFLVILELFRFFIHKHIHWMSYFLYSVSFNMSNLEKRVNNMDSMTNKNYEIIYILNVNINFAVKSDWNLNNLFPARYRYHSKVAYW